ncbi:MAG: DNA adenine methylase [Aquificaceae bacterium]|uniref:DNA adenine methylase n=1 Tax=Hydrogenobacter sp. Uz 6-8 TaxID=3384828 RepID=UPI0030AF00B3
MHICERLKIRPFVKWAGGKRQLVKVLREHLPESYQTYIEPFLGGGALFFELMPEKAVVSDINEELINAYRVIRENVDELIQDLSRHVNSPEYYYRIRSLDPKKLDPVKRASRFIYLNKTCYNGLYRENSKGEFNVPFGYYENPKILDEENLRAISEYFNSSQVIILNSDFMEVCALAKSGDFVYLDPPYYPYDNVSSFTKYTRYDFTERDHLELAEVFKELNRKGVYVMLTNSNTDFIKRLYSGYRIKELYAFRAINCRGDLRKRRKSDLLITNY